MDGSGVTRRLYKGGGTVECRFGLDDGTMETFHMEKDSSEPGKVAFCSTFDESVMFIFA